MILADPLPFFVVGPTAVGKSELAVAAAERCGGEVVSADAFQIYAGLNILTAQPSPAVRARAPHHLVGELPITERCDVAKFLALAEKRIGEIQSRGRRPIVVGGTGLYVRAISHGLAELPPADAPLRAELESKPLADLLSHLAELDPTAVATIDRANPRRVVRALEVCLKTGEPFSRFREQWKRPRFPLHGVVLARPRVELGARIDSRTEAMFRDGVVDEVRAVTAISDTAAQALGFREIRSLIAGQLRERECVERIQRATRQYAKRQLTWFRRDPFSPLDLSDSDSSEAELLRRIALG